MKSIKNSILILTLFLYGFATAQTADIIQDLQVDVVYLASDLMMGRETGTKGEEMAGRYIASRFEEIGLQPMGTDGTWFFPFDFKFMANPHADPETAEKRIGKNVVAFLDNGADQTVVIGGHYDHLGMGDGGGSLHAGEAAIHNGADDNASGIAAMFYIAKTLKESDLKNNNYLFIAFSGEELGLYGSKNFVMNPTIALDKMNYLINMDMVGRLNEEKVVAINGTGTSPSWKSVLEKITVADIKIKTHDSGVGPSDHTSFYNEGIPVLHFFSGQHSDYHKPGDDSHLVNYQGIYEISEYILAVVRVLNNEGKLAYSETKTESESQKATAFKVTLGVMPDYVYDGKGMRIDGVIDGRPAQNAKLEKGDIIIKIGDLEIKDIYDYMKGLGMYKIGDKTTVVVLRGKEEVSREVTF
jgi:peptidase M28-like protein/PDZ domain-containing protein